MKKFIIGLTLVAFIGAGAFGQTKSSAKIVTSDTKIEKVSYDQDPTKQKDVEKAKPESKPAVSSDQKAAPANSGCTPAEAAKCGPDKPAGCTTKPGCPSSQKSCCSKSPDPGKK